MSLGIPTVQGFPQVSHSSGEFVPLTGYDVADMLSRSAVKDEP